MGKQRDLYFEKHIKNAPTAEEYLKQLNISPYRTHRRMAQALLPELENLISEAKRQKEIDDFAKTLEL